MGTYHRSEWAFDCLVLETELVGVKLFHSEHLLLQNPRTYEFSIKKKKIKKITLCCGERKINGMQSTLRHINISIFQETTSYYVQILLLHEKGIF